MYKRQVLARAQRPFLLEEHTPGSTTTTPPPRDGAAALARVLELVTEWQAAATAPVLGIGIGTPGIVGRDGVVHTAPNLGWIDLPLRERVAAASGLPVSVCNDADAAAHAEYSPGDGGDDLLLVKNGRGVGCGLIVGGSRVRGAHPVSYTHLDVYKRQIQPRAACLLTPPAPCSGMTMGSTGLLPLCWITRTNRWRH